MLFLTNRSLFSQEQQKNDFNSNTTEESVFSIKIEGMDVFALDFLMSIFVKRAEVWYTVNREIHLPIDKCTGNV